MGEDMYDAYKNYIKAVQNGEDEFEVKTEDDYNWMIGQFPNKFQPVYEVYTGKTLPKLEFNVVRGLEGIKEATIDLDGFPLKICVAHTLGNARILMDKLQKGELDYHVVEVMACPGGCIGGAGQPYHHGNVEILKARTAAIYREDDGKPLRKSHLNPDIQRLYKVFLGEPLGEMSEKLLHTHYYNKAIK